MNSTRVHSATLFLGADPDGIDVRYRADSNGPYAVLDIGDVTVHVSQSSPAALRRLAAACAEIADWQEQQQAVKAVAA